MPTAAASSSSFLASPSVASTSPIYKHRTTNRKGNASVAALAAFAFLPCNSASPLSNPGLVPAGWPPRLSGTPGGSPEAELPLPRFLVVDERVLSRSWEPLQKRASSDINLTSSSSNNGGLTYPQPFDTTLSTNFTSLTCPSFMTTFLDSSDFRACHPFSLLLSTSNAFFKAYSAFSSSSNSSSASGETATLHQTLDAACAAPLTSCQALMNSLAAEIQQENRCAEDLYKGNAVATEALQGFRNYGIMKRVGCLLANGTSSSSNSASMSVASWPSTASSSASGSSSRLRSREPSPGGESHFARDVRPQPSMPHPVRAWKKRTEDNPYCFEQAAGSSDPDDMYFYYLPEGVGLPSGTKPTCDICTQALMAIYASQAGNSTLQLSQTYSQARMVANARCGPTFASLPMTIASGSGRVVRSRLTAAVFVGAVSLVVAAVWAL